MYVCVDSSNLYHSNGDKTWLVVKDGLEDAATEAFVGTSVQVTTQDRKHLRAALESRSFVEQCVSQQVEEWIAEYVGAIVHYCLQPPTSCLQRL